MKCSAISRKFERISGIFIICATLRVSRELGKIDLFDRAALGVDLVNENHALRGRPLMNAMIDT
jgi:hypothetical protein